MECIVSRGKTPSRNVANTAQVWVKSINWANCHEMMKSVVVMEMERIFRQPGL